MERPRMKGFSLAALKKNPSLIPLLFVGLGGPVAGLISLIRWAVYSPDITFNPNKNPRPGEYYRNKQYKLWCSVDHDVVPKAEPPEF